MVDYYSSASGICEIFFSSLLKKGVNLLHLEVFKGISYILGIYYFLLCSWQKKEINPSDLLKSIAKLRNHSNKKGFKKK